MPDPQQAAKAQQQQVDPQQAQAQQPEVAGAQAKNQQQSAAVLRTQQDQQVGLKAVQAVSDAQGALRAANAAYQHTNAYLGCMKGLKDKKDKAALAVDEHAAEANYASVQAKLAAELTTQAADDVAKENQGAKSSWLSSTGQKHRDAAAAALARAMEQCEIAKKAAEEGKAAEKKAQVAFETVQYSDLNKPWQQKDVELDKANPKEQRKFFWSGASFEKDSWDGGKAPVGDGPGKEAVTSPRNMGKNDKGESKWHGFDGGGAVAEGQDNAMRVAETHNGATMEGLLTKRGVRQNMPEYEWQKDRTTNSEQMWKDVSADFAQNPGEHPGIVSGQMRPGNIFQNTELPKMSAPGGQAQDVEAFDARTGAAKPDKLWDRQRDGQVAPK